LYADPSGLKKMQPHVIPKKGTVNFETKPFENRHVFLGKDDKTPVSVEGTLDRDNAQFVAIAVKAYDEKTKKVTMDDGSTWDFEGVFLQFGVHMNATFQEDCKDPKAKSGDYYWAQYKKGSTSVKPDTPEMKKVFKPLEGTWGIDGSENVKEGMPHYYPDQDLIASHPVRDTPGDGVKLNLKQVRFFPKEGEMPMILAVELETPASELVKVRIARQQTVPQFKVVDAYEFQLYLVEAATKKPLGYISWGFTNTSDKDSFYKVSEQDPKWIDGIDEKVWAK
jgi:hypothetical protein